MKTRIIVGAICLIALSIGIIAQEKSLTATEAKDHVGSMATVCGKVMSPRYATSTRGQPTFLNFDKAYPNQDFTVVIWGNDRSKFDSPETSFRDKSICVTGKIVAYRGGAEIVATDPKQIRVGGPSGVWAPTAQYHFFRPSEEHAR